MDYSHSLKHNNYPPTILNQSITNKGSAPTNASKNALSCKYLYLSIKTNNLVNYFIAIYQQT